MNMLEKVERWLACQSKTKATWFAFFGGLFLSLAGASFIIWLTIFSPPGTIVFGVLGGSMYFILFMIYKWAEAFVHELKFRYKDKT